MEVRGDEEGRFGRFKDAVWFPKEETDVLVGGAGGIGSWLSLLLARAGFTPTVYDFDEVEEHNIGGQLYGQAHVGKLKVEALESVIYSLSDTTITGMSGKYISESLTNNYVFSAFDNIQARRDMFQNWVKEYGEDKGAVYIDGRLTMEQMQIFCIQGGDKDAIRDYEETHLFPDADVEEAPCTLKQTSHSAAMIASHMVAFFTNFLATKQGKPCTVPYYWEYFIPIDMLTREAPGTGENESYGTGNTD